MPHCNHIGFIGRLKFPNSSVCVVCTHSAPCLQTALCEYPQPRARCPTPGIRRGGQPEPSTARRRRYAVACMPMLAAARGQGERLPLVPARHDPCRLPPAPSLICSSLGCHPLAPRLRRPLRRDSGHPSALPPAAARDSPRCRATIFPLWLPDYAGRRRPRCAAPPLGSPREPPLPNRPVSLLSQVTTE
jgi:hypothetical protein